ncbi:hypothetical protein H2199_008831 [Coniosporium tulheliwenetii]|uniref:Uncharacterized protein n=1 Tax=Coniosporium tulheliwenetii TaxID=3383036 RepID=A0ACC2YHX9_9PEZI|nr:hypothetical protein H2199_008831 [Cladosporium sp. JES 115]
MDYFAIKDTETTTSGSLSELDSALFVDHNQLAAQPAEVIEVDDDEEGLKDLPPEQQHALYSQALERRYRRRRTPKIDVVRAKMTWSHKRNRTLTEPERDGHGHKYWYCKHCKGYGTTNLVNARQHLASFHNILIGEEASKAEQERTTTINALFDEQRRSQQSNADECFRRQLRAIVDKTMVEKALVTLITRPEWLVIDPIVY